MAFARFSIIVSTDARNGIALKGKMPWHSSNDMKFFRETTIGRGKNVVVMGRKTYETIPPENRPLAHRRCCVLSRRWKQEENYDVTVYHSIPELLQSLGSARKRYDTVFVIGGEEIYRQFLQNYLYLCDKIYWTRFREDYECDRFFPADEHQLSELPVFKPPTVFHTYARHHISPKVNHGEITYVDLLRKMVDEGEKSADKNGVQTQVCFGEQLEFDLSRKFPIITTNKVEYSDILEELLFFIAGETDTTILEEQNVNIWKPATSKESLIARNLDYEVGEMGPMYGHQWRKWGSPYYSLKSREERDEEPSEPSEPSEPLGSAEPLQGIDQLFEIVQGLKKNPYSRAHLLTAWSPSDVLQMVKAPSDFACQFHVNGNGQFLDCLVFQRSSDLFREMPGMVVRYSLLTHMLAHLIGLKPRKLLFSIGSAYILSNDFNAIAQQIVRDPKPFPQLKFVSPRTIRRLSDFNRDNIIIEGYSSWPRLGSRINE